MITQKDIYDTKLEKDTTKKGYDILKKFDLGCVIKMVNEPNNLSYEKSGSVKLMDDGV